MHRLYPALLARRQNESVAPSSLEAPTACSPSPQPSPSWRGRFRGSASANLARPAYSRDGVRRSLSPGERTGVRGNATSDRLRLPMFRNLAAQALAALAVWLYGGAAGAAPETNLV